MRAPQQPVAEPGVARGAREGDRADGQDRRDRGIGIELALLGASQLGDDGVEQIGVGQPHGQGCAGDVGGQGGEHARRRACDKLGLVEIGLQHRRGRRSAQPRAQAGAGDDGLGEQRVLGIEVRIEGAARQPGRQHDVIDVGAGIAAQAKQTAGMIENFGAGAGSSGGVLRHDMFTNISYVIKHIIRP